MKKITLMLAAFLCCVMVKGQDSDAQQTVFGYTYEGTTLYYVLSPDGDAAVVAPQYFTPDIASEMM